MHCIPVVVQFQFFASGCEAELSAREAAAIVDAWQPMVQALQVALMRILYIKYLMASLSLSVKKGHKIGTFLFVNLCTFMSLNICNVMNTE